MIQELRASFDSGKTRTYEWRVSQLNAMKTMLEENIDPICEAMAKDLGRGRWEGFLVKLQRLRQKSSLRWIILRRG